MFTKFASKLFAGLILAMSFSAANASLMEIRFTAAGSATGAGVLTLDSALIAANASYCCSAVPAGFKSLDLTLNFGAGNTVFHLGDLSGTTFILGFNASKIITDINFWGTNAAGVTLTGVSPFTEFASGAMGANGNVRYTISSIGNASQVPEPASLALLGLGMLGIAGVRRRT